MIKIFLLAIAVWLVITVLKRYLKNISAPLRSAEESNGANPEKSESENMVQCVHCGLHLLGSDSIVVDGRYYCCEAHRSAAHPASSKS